MRNKLITLAIIFVSFLLQCTLMKGIAIGSISPNLLVILCAARREELAAKGAEMLAERIGVFSKDCGEKLYVTGPADAVIAKVNDIYKKVIYIKARRYETLVELKDTAEKLIREREGLKDLTVQFDFNPVNSF